MVKYSEDSDFFAPELDRPRVNQGPKRWYQRWWGRMIMAVVTILAILGVALGMYGFHVASLVRSGQLTTADILGPGMLPTANVPLDTLATPNDPVLGPKNAKVVVVEFSDFQCPFCEQAFPVVKQLLKDYGDRILFVYRNFPLAADHPEAIPAAEAAACAFEQGNFWGMHDKLFSNQANLGETAYKTYALQLGLNTDQFDSCMTSHKYFDKIQTDYADGIAAGVQATPTFFINGKKVEGAVPLATLEGIIVSELSR